MSLPDTIQELLENAFAQGMMAAALNRHPARDEPDDIPEYVPSQQDWDDYHAWCREVEANNYEAWLRDEREVPND